MERFAVIGKVGTWFAVARMIDHGHGPVVKHDVKYFAYSQERLGGEVSQAATPSMAPCFLVTLNGRELCRFTSYDQARKYALRLMTADPNRESNFYSIQVS